MDPAFVMLLVFSTFLNTSIIRLGDTYSLVVDLTCDEVPNSVCHISAILLNWIPGLISS